MGKKEKPDLNSDKQAQIVRAQRIHREIAERQTKSPPDAAINVGGADNVSVEQKVVPPISPREFIQRKMQEEAARSAKRK